MNGSSKAQMAGYAAAALMLVVGGVLLLDRGEGAAEGGARVSLGGARGAGAASAASGGAGRRPGGGRPVYVHVAGAVKRPVVYRVVAGSRVAAAVRRAGGLTRRADLTAFNLAAPLRDAQQVVIPRRGEAGAALGAAGTPGTAAPAGVGEAPGAGGRGKQISLATATPAQLDTLEGIGP